MRLFSTLLTADWVTFLGGAAARTVTDGDTLKGGGATTLNGPRQRPKSALYSQAVINAEATE